jgi:hypothetical protein
VEDVADLGDNLHTLTLAGIDDDTQGEVTEIVWGAELDAQRLSQDDWPALLQGTAEDPDVFSAYLRTIKWNTATAADKDLLQAPFRGRIHCLACRTFARRQQGDCGRSEPAAGQRAGPGHRTLRSTSL